MTPCARCKLIDLVSIAALQRHYQTVGRSDVPIGYPHHATYRELRDSAKRCPSCALFYEASNADERFPNKPPIEEDDCVRLSAVTAKQWPRYILEDSPASAAALFGLMVEVESATSNSSSYQKKLDLWVPYDSPDRLASDVLQRPVGPANDTTIISQWLSHCNGTHPACRKTAPGIESVAEDNMVTLPTRVIDVLGFEENGHQPYLHTANGSKGKYVALSHCWGKAQVTRTISSKLGDFQQCIPIDMLCKNFQDAIFVTKSLGFQYLWIDSLCIVQDSAADWESESSKMARVYNLAALTLSAANASAADEGFLKPRIPAVERSVALPHYNGYRNLDGHYYIAAALDDFSKEVDSAPLSTRGWTLQERLLSRRNVFFGRDQFHWECQEARWSESTHLLKQESSDSGGDMSIWRRSLYQSANDDAKVFDVWWALVREYTKRSLTHGSDILPALSGIASIFSQNIHAAGNQYVAGLWSHNSDLARGLLWKSFGRTAEDQHKIRAPSWSWISHQGRIDPASNNGATVIIEDIDIQVELSGQDRFGALRSAKLSFTGFLVAIPIIKRTGPDYQDLDGKQLYVYTTAVLHDEKMHQVGTGVLDEPNAPIASPTYCVPIRHHQRGMDVLLLRKLAGSENSYQRVGTAEMADHPRPATPALGSPMMKLLSSAEKQRISVI
ncbi:hypothetical protein BP5796_01937 [Coleophoma crateriformis]|uniref:Heterokaryon incompatibility domain-containing protein n=1 Tax=Coleophoma crateriformis TaxID=565419 RepID=A0A3D8T1U9_9HELO|nr:hypothetical protein BP5796_01937 [Coleophoma crateriformis]